MTTVSTLGALTALVVAIVFILRKVPPAYGMLAARWQAAWSAARISSIRSA